MKTLNEMGAGGAAGAAAPLNSTGTSTDGSIAGLGGKGGEPGVSKKRKSPVLARLRRKSLEEEASQETLSRLDILRKYVWNR